MHHQRVGGARNVGELGVVRTFGGFGGAHTFGGVGGARTVGGASGVHKVNEVHRVPTAHGILGVHTVCGDGGDHRFGGVRGVCTAVVEGRGNMVLLPVRTQGLGWQFVHKAFRFGGVHSRQGQRCTHSQQGWLVHKFAEFHRVPAVYWVHGVHTVCGDG